MTGWQIAWVVYVGVVPFSLWHWWAVTQRPASDPRWKSRKPPESWLPGIAVACALTWPIGYFMVYLWPDCWTPKRWRSKR